MLVFLQHSYNFICPIIIQRKFIGLNYLSQRDIYERIIIFCLKEGLSLFELDTRIKIGVNMTLLPIKYCAKYIVLASSLNKSISKIIPSQFL
jgi:hypothetical protein